MHFRPLHDRVLVRRIDAEEKTKGGIIIPDNAKEKPQEGEIVAAGPGARNEQGQQVALDVKPRHRRTSDRTNPSGLVAARPRLRERNIYKQLIAAAAGRGSATTRSYQSG
ncbi:MULTISPECIES: co-chaperone GroES [unclassified Bradyrhizobium]|uniref:co-chaperone GroES n=1 Tax=unclassified Bradyrhizobium TaxID=2631580 RepID=UPI0028E544B8|nr:MULTISPECIES: co-chaperone GroES [unclassified Bradyrhizobium]